MFAFAVWAMPPLYYLFCDLTGIGVRPAVRYDGAASQAADRSRTVQITFTTSNAATMPWAFEARQFQMSVHPGEPASATFYARNTTSRRMVAQAIPNISPASATRYFHKTECFCFNSQPLGPGEDALLPMQFIVDQDLPPAITEITLNYNLFDITGRAALAASAAQTDGSAR